MKQVMRYVLAAAVAGGFSAPLAVRAADTSMHARPASLGVTAAPLGRAVRPAVDAGRAPQTLEGNLDPMRGPVSTSLPASPRDLTAGPSDAPYHTWSGAAPN